MKNYLIYPLTRESAPILRYKQLVVQSSKVGGVVPKGRFSTKANLRHLDGGKNTDDLLYGNFEKNLDKYDTVVFLDDCGNTKLESLNNKIDLALKAEKEILLHEILARKINTKGTDIKLINLNHVEHEVYSQEKRLLSIDVPVIFVMGAGDKCNKFELQLAIREHLNTLGYKIYQLGTKDYSKIFSFEPLPTFVFSNDLSLEQKILGLNHYVNKQLLKEKPDIAVVGVPGGVIPLGDNYYNSFSELAYIISNAIQPDITILSTYFFPKMNEDFLLKLREMMTYRFSVVPAYFHVSNSSYNVNIDNDEPELEYFTINFQTVEEMIKTNFDGSKLTVFNLFSDNSEAVYQKMIDELSENVSLV